MSLPATIALAALALFASLPCFYLLGLTLLSQRPTPPPAPAARRLRFDLIVPAHDEAAGIAATIASLRALVWPAGGYRVRVVADNCSDATAALARAAGADVLERFDEARRGKGYALAHAFASSLAEDWADAVVVVDADSLAAPNLLDACAARLEAGALAVQLHYGVRDAGASWRTRLMAIAYGAMHALRSQARERLGLSCGVRGNGWCLHRSVLERLPYAAYSRAEDLEYGIALGLAGIRVHYAAEAEVLGEMARGAAAAGTQRRRWERGRFELLRRCAMPLLGAALARRSVVCLDLALDLLVLPLSYVALAVLAFLAAAAAAAQPGWLALAVADALALMLYVLRGWQLSGVGWRGLADLAGAPLFVLWKLVAMSRRGEGARWVRTGRNTA